MKLKIKKITGQKDITTKDGRNLTKTQFITENDEVLDTFGSIEVGQEYEGDVKENEYGKTFTKTKTGKPFMARQADPNTMLISYAKDVVTAFIEKGTIEDEKEAAKQILNFTVLFKKAYDSLTSGSAPRVKEEDKEEEKDEAVSANYPDKDEYDEPPY